MKSPVEHKRRTVFGIYTSYAIKYPLLLIGVFGGTILLQIATLVAPLYLRQFFNVLASNSPSPATISTLTSILSVVVAMWFLEWASRRLQDVCNIYMTGEVMKNLFNSSFEYLLGHSYNFFISQFAGTLTHRVSKFARAFETLFDSIAIQFFPTFIFISGAVIVLYLRHHSLGIALGIWSACFIAFQIYVARLRKSARAARAEADTKVTGNLADAISNQATIVLFSGAKYEEARFEKTVAHWQAATLRSWIADAWIWSGIGLFMLGIEGGLMYGAILLWQKGLLTLGDFVLIQAYLFTAFDRLVSLNRELRRFFDAYSDADEMVQILDTLHEVHDKPHAGPLHMIKGAVEFNSINFHFHEEKGIFENFNLKIEGGEKVALIGPSGAGKSTITKLILRLFDVKSGAIEIDGQNIADVTQESLRNAISFVPQEPILFHRTLMENIRYGRRDATDDDVIDAAKKAHCHEFISTLQHGYDTFVGERGIKLSGGERQRVAIARAILKDSPILMLDEATSSLDSTSELLIQDALAKLMEGKTVIVIAHRLSTIMKMDRIIAIENGRVTEQGTHQELLAKKGIYAQLWSHQAGGFIQDE